MPSAMIKACLLNRSDSSGGAARAAYRIHSALRSAGLDSTLRVCEAKGGDQTVVAPATSTGRAYAALLPLLGQKLRKLHRTDSPVLHSPALFSAVSIADLNRSEADVVNLHWVNDEMLSIRAIGRLRKPTVWTLHDMWPFCGAEHYTDGLRWRNGYTADNRLPDEGGFDLNRWVWRRKQKHWKTPLHIVTPSRWLGDCARQSALMHDWPVSVIPNAIDTEVWQPTEMSAARSVLGLPPHAKLILFGAMGGGADPRKGFDLLQSAFRRLRGGKTDVELVVLGQSAPTTQLDFGFPIRYVGHLHDDLTLRLLYGAVDLVAIPSRQDNLPNIGVEAIACGTPVVAFDTGGLPDIVAHQQTGYLATAFDTEDFARGMEWLLSDTVRLREISSGARADAVKRFSYPVVAAAYLRVFEQALHANSEPVR